MKCRRCLLETSAEHRELDCISALRTKARLLEEANIRLNETVMEFRMKKEFMFFDASTPKVDRGLDGPSEKLFINVEQSPCSGDGDIRVEGDTDHSTFTPGDGEIIEDGKRYFSGIRIPMPASGEVWDRIFGHCHHLSSSVRRIREVILDDYNLSKLWILNQNAEWLVLRVKCGCLRFVSEK